MKVTAVQSESSHSHYPREKANVGFCHGRPHCRMTTVQTDEHIHSQTRLHLRVNNLSTIRTDRYDNLMIKPTTTVGHFCLHDLDFENVYMA